MSLDKNTSKSDALSDIRARVEKGYCVGYEQGHDIEQARADVCRLLSLLDEAREFLALLDDVDGWTLSPLVADKLVALLSRMEE
jgi:hypothetical protein